MPVKIEDRPIETVREQVIDQLIMNYSHGEISLEAFERRLDEAMASSCNKELLELTADLDLQVDQDYVDNKKQDMDFNPAPNFNYQPGESEEQETIFNILSGSKRQGPWKVAKEIRVVTILSGADLDFSEARFTHPQVRLKVFSLLSGGKIHVPENINVVSKVLSIVGGVENKAPCYADANAPTLYIEGISIFSGITIKVKRTMKDKFVAFADNLKNLFS